jgi:Ca2+-dependent lipid-binding protein
MAPPPEQTQIDVKLIVNQGDGLPAKDRNIFGKKTTSDPYVELWLNGVKKGRTKTVKKSLSPVWDETFKFSCYNSAEVLLKILDEDLLSDPDLMGIVKLEINADASLKTTTEWREIPSYSAVGAKGRLQITLKTKVHR